MEGHLDQSRMAEPMAYILQKEILTLQEACLYLGRKASYMYKMTSKRLIPHYSPSGKILYFKRSELDECVLKSKRKSIDEIKSEIGIKKRSRS